MIATWFTAEPWGFVGTGERKGAKEKGGGWGEGKGGEKKGEGERVREEEGMGKKRRGNKKGR